MSAFPDLMFPMVNGGRIVKTLLENAAQAEADGELDTAAALLDRAMRIDASR